MRTNKAHAGAKRSSCQLSTLLTKGLEAYLGKQLGVQYRQNYKTAFSCFMQATKLGDANAAWLTGRCYFYGRGCRQSYKNAIKYYRTAAVKGLKEALFDLANCYRQGLGVRKSNKIALKYFMFAGEQGVVDAQYSVFLMYRDYQCIEQDKAMAFLKSAAEKGHAPAQRCLGECYYYGDFGLEEDKYLAFYWCECAAKQGDPEGQYCCGLAYQKGEGVQQDIEKAIEFHRAASQQGYVEAYLQLFRAIVQANRSDLYEEGAQALHHGARVGDKECMYGLSLLYQSGLYGFKIDLKKADYWYRRYTRLKHSD